MWLMHAGYVAHQPPSTGSMVGAVQRRRISCPSWRPAAR